jgi:FAD/FMN-containing dehydrogenase
VGDQVTLSATDRLVADLSSAQIQELVSGLHAGSDTLGPSDPEYAVARRVWNGAIDRRPGLIVRAASVDDVRRTVDFAGTHRLALSIRSGGHDVPGRSVNDGGVVLDLGRLNGISIDPAAGPPSQGNSGVARVQAGCLWRDVDQATATFGLAVTGGQISTTGVGGLTLGGGMGWLMRHHGLTVDNLLTADVVSADGRLLTVGPEEHPDLFWGLRGGGGNFGVVTEFRFRLAPVSTVLAGLVLHPIERARELLRFYQDLSTGAPDELTIMMLFLPAPPQPFLPVELHFKPIVALGVCYSGPLEEGERLIAPARAFGPPLADLIKPMPYTTLQRLYDVGSPAGIPETMRSEFLDDLSDRAIETAVGFAANATSTLSQILFTNMRGAVSRVGKYDTAFVHRDVAHCLEILAKWEVGEDAAPHAAWAQQFLEAMRPYSAGGQYVNFTDAEGSARVESAYDPVAFGRLARLKAVWDPANLFHFNQNIPPESALP